MTLIIVMNDLETITSRIEVLVRLHLVPADVDVTFDLGFLAWT